MEAQPNNKAVPDEGIMHLVSRLAAEVRLEMERRLAPHGITTQQWSVLARLQQLGDMTPSALAHHLGIDGSAITRLLDRLEKKQMVRRVRNPKDRRSLSVELLPEGRELLMTLPPVEKQVGELFMQGISLREEAQIKLLLKTMLRNGDRGDLPKPPPQV